MYRAVATTVLRGPQSELALFRYDKLVIAVGSVSSTHGVPGLEHCFQLKTVADAQAIRRRVLGEYFCTSSSSHSSVCIAVVVCGGGPTGVETAAVRPPTPHTRVVRSLDY